MIPQWIDIYMGLMDRKDLAYVREDPWISFLEGRNSDYPVVALRRELSSIRNKMQLVRSDPTTPDTRLADWALGLNPAATHELVKLTLGGYLHGRIWIPHTRLRYFDPVGRRAGLPPDVAGDVLELLEKF